MVRFIHAVHWAVLAFVVLAWTLPWQGVLWAHIVFVPLMILHWRTNRNRCVLSQLEEKFKSRAASGALPAALPVEVEENHFIRWVWTRIFGRAASAKTIERTNYAVMTVVWLASVARLIAIRSA